MSEGAFFKPKVTLKNIGEFGLIERIKAKTRVDKSVICGIGDDAAVIKLNKNKFLLLTSDILIEDVHFKRQDATPYQVGRKALAVNISDIAAMGGIPKYALLSVGLPSNLTLDFVDRLYLGIRKLAENFKINIVGGDTSSSKKLIISVSLIGEVRNKELVTRSGAKKGDIIFVTGSLGMAWKGKHLNFTPKLEEAHTLVRNFKISSMIDISDGLSSDLWQIAKAGKVGAVLFENLIPLAKGVKALAKKKKKNPVNFALNSGEEFELLFTLSPGEARKLVDSNLDFPLTCIGEIITAEHGLQLINRRHQLRRLKPGGFRHF